jgi:hypothetical protein
MTFQGNIEVGSQWSLTTGLIYIKCTREGKLKLRSNYTSYCCLIEVVTKAGFTLY